MQKLTALCLAALIAPGAGLADEMLSADALVASVVYHADGSSTLWMAAEGSPDEPGSYRFE